jgi:hypothetical protein
MTYPRTDCSYVLVSSRVAQQFAMKVAEAALSPRVIPSVLSDMR